MDSASTKRNRFAEHTRLWNEDAFIRAQALEVEEVDVGRVVIRLPQARDSHRGGGRSAAPALNGGIIAYMFVGALGWSISSWLLSLPEAEGMEADDFGRVTLNLDITYLDAALGERFEAQGNVVRASRSTAFAEGRLLDAGGKVCATAKGIWRIFWPRPGASKQA